MNQPSQRGFTLVEMCSVLGIIAMLVALLFPVFTQAQAKAQQMNCLTQLSELGVALHMYARDHDGRFPPTHHDWKPLVNGGYVDDAELLWCPTDEDRETLTRAGGGYSSYQYRGGLTSDVRPDIPLAGDWTFRHDAGAGVLLLDGRTRWLRRADWVPIAPVPRTTPTGFVTREEALPTPIQGETWDPNTIKSNEW